MKTSVAEDEFVYAVDGNLGWCSKCQAFTRDCTEPDAEEYDCPKCDSPNTVTGAESALVADLFTFKDWS